MYIYAQYEFESVSRTKLYTIRQGESRQAVRDAQSHGEPADIIGYVTVQCAGYMTFLDSRGFPRVGEADARAWRREVNLIMKG